MATPYDPPVIQEPVLDGEKFTSAWYQWLTQKVARKLFAPVSNAPPASSLSQGTSGQIAYDQNFVYIYVGTQWKRAALNTF